MGRLMVLLNRRELDSGNQKLCAPPESTDGPLAHSTPLGKPAENLVDSAKADETDSEAGFQLDKADRKKARRWRNRIEKRPLSQLDGLPKDKSGPAENPADSAKAEEVGLEAGLQLDGRARKKVERHRRLDGKHLTSQFDTVHYPNSQQCREIRYLG